MSVGARIDSGLFVVAPFTFCFVYLYVCSFVFWKPSFVFCSIDSFVVSIWFWKPSFVFWKPSLFWPAVYVGARIDLGLFLVALFLLPFLSCLSYFLTCVSFCVWSSATFLLSWTQVEAEKPSPRFDIPPSLGCPFWTLQVRSILSITGNQNTYTIVQTQLKHKTPVVN